MTYISESQKRMLAEALQIRTPADFQQIIRPAPLYKIAVGPTFAIVYPVQHETPNVIELAFAHVYTAGSGREHWLRNLLAMLHKFANEVLPVSVQLIVTFRSVDSHSVALTLTKLGFKLKGAEDLTAENYRNFRVPSNWLKEY